MTMLNSTFKAISFLTALLLAVFIVFTPLNTVVSEFLGWSIYPYYLLLLIFLNVALLGYTSESKTTVLRNPANILMFCFTAMLMYKVESIDSLQTVLGAVLLPYVLGALYVLKRNETSQFEICLFVLLVVKSILVLFFFEELIKDYPIRPQFEGRAIYLRFGWALDVVPFLIVYFLYKKQKIKTVHVVIVSAILFLLAFVIVTMASRTMLILSVFLTMIFSLIYITDSKVKLFGGAVYPIFVLIILLVFPVKQEHFFNMINTMTSFVTCSITDGCLPEDKSTAIRLEGFFSTLSNKNDTSQDYPLDIDSANFYWAGHFWLGQIKYYTGMLGLLLFVSLIICFMVSLYRLFKRKREGSSVSGVLLIMMSLSYLFHIVYAGGILNDPVFFLLLGLVVNLSLSNTKNSSVIKGLSLNRQYQLLGLKN